MLIDSIVLAILVCSIGGALIILVRKIPVLIALPHHGTTGLRKHRLVIDYQEKVKNILEAFEKQVFLHKLLSWVKIMTLRIEVKVDHLLHDIRRKQNAK